MKRAMVVVTLIHFAMALLLMGTAIVIVMQIRTPEVAKEQDAIKGLIVGASFLAVPAASLLIATWGLRELRRWGWWTALLTDTAVLATLIYSVFSENTVDREEVGFAILFALMCVVLLLPVVRNSCVGEGTQVAHS
jgi:cytochrome c oxidase subunit IV